MIELFDSHAHLAMLTHVPATTAVEHAKTVGITKIVTVSTDEASWSKNASFAGQFDNVYFSVGMHPHEATHWTKARQSCEHFLSDAVPRKCVAVGEVGLDFYGDGHTTKDEQFEAFTDQLALAKQFNLPVIIHCRDAFSELFNSIRRNGIGQKGGVMHCFTGSVSHAKSALDLGLKISFSGVVTFKNAASIREALRIVPLSEILLETDCPFLAPMPLRGKPNEPALMRHTAEYMASFLGMPLDEFAARTFANTCEFFGVK